MNEKAFSEIPFDEYQKRLMTAKEKMAEHGIDGLLLFCRENQIYYGGWRDTWDHNFLVALIIPCQGNPVLVGPGHVEWAVRKYTYVEEIITWEELVEDPNPVHSVAEAIKDRGLSEKRIGLELGYGMFPSNATPDEIARIRAEVPLAKFVDATNMIWEQRKIKTSWEIALFRRLGAIVVEGFEAGLNVAGEGISEIEIQNVIWESFLRAGVADTMMQGGVIIRSHPYDVYTPAYTGRATPRKLQKGDQLMLDGGPTLKGYFTDIQRQAVIGPPSDLQKRLRELANVGFEAALKIVGPGTPISDLWRIALESQRKHDPKYAPKWKFVGHSIGLRIHEPPALTQHEKSRLESGMVITLEVAGYDIPKWRVMGAFPEDMLLVTDDGYENLTGGLSRDLWAR